MDLQNDRVSDDPSFINDIVTQLKSQGIFDQFRKECISDVDTKPAYQNLRHLVGQQVSTYLSKIEWTPNLNKNQLRENIRKYVNKCKFIEPGIERIVDQLVNPRINTVLVPKVEHVVNKYLGINEDIGIGTSFKERNSLFFEEKSHSGSSNFTETVPTAVVQPYSTENEIDTNVSIRTDFTNTSEKLENKTTSEEVMSSAVLTTVGSSTDRAAPQDNIVKYPLYSQLHSSKPIVDEYHMNEDEDDDEASPPFELHVKSDCDSPGSVKSDCSIVIDPNDISVETSSDIANTNDYSFKRESLSPLVYPRHVENTVVKPSESITKTKNEDASEIITKSTIVEEIKSESSSKSSTEKEKSKDKSKKDSDQKNDTIEKSLKQKPKDNRDKDSKNEKHSKESTRSKTDKSREKDLERDGNKHKSRKDNSSHSYKAKPESDKSSRSKDNVKDSHKPKTDSGNVRKSGDDEKKHEIKKSHSHRDDKYKHKSSKKDGGTSSHGLNKIEHKSDKSNTHKSEKVSSGYTDNKSEKTKVHSENKDINDKKLDTSNENTNDKIEKQHSNSSHEKIDKQNTSPESKSSKSSVNADPKLQKSHTNTDRKSGIVKADSSDLNKLGEQNDADKTIETVSKSDKKDNVKKIDKIDNKLESEKEGSKSENKNKRPLSDRSEQNSKKHKSDDHKDDKKDSSNSEKNKNDARKSSEQKSKSKCNPDDKYRKTDRRSPEGDCSGPSSSSKSSQSADSITAEKSSSKKGNSASSSSSHKTKKTYQQSTLEEIDIFENCIQRLHRPKIVPQTHKLVENVNTTIKVRSVSEINNSISDIKSITLLNNCVTKKEEVHFPPNMQDDDDLSENKKTSTKDKAITNCILNDQGLTSPDKHVKKKEVQSPPNTEENNYRQKNIKKLVDAKDNAVIANSVLKEENISPNNYARKQKVQSLPKMHEGDDKPQNVKKLVNAKERDVNARSILIHKNITSPPATKKAVKFPLNAREDDCRSKNVKNLVNARDKAVIAKFLSKVDFTVSILIPEIVLLRLENRNSHKNKLSTFEAPLKKIGVNNFVNGGSADFSRNNNVDDNDISSRCYSDRHKVESSSSVNIKPKIANSASDIKRIMKLRQQYREHYKKDKFVQKDSLVINKIGIQEKIRSIKLLHMCIKLSRIDRKFKEVNGKFIIQSDANTHLIIGNTECVNLNVDTKVNASNSKKSCGIITNIDHVFKDETSKKINSSAHKELHFTEQSPELSKTCSREVKTSRNSTIHQSESISNKCSETVDPEEFCPIRSKILTSAHSPNTEDYSRKYFAQVSKTCSREKETKSNIIHQDKNSLNKPKTVDSKEMCPRKSKMVSRKNLPTRNASETVNNRLYKWLRINNFKHATNLRWRAYNILSNCSDYEVILKECNKLVNKKQKRKVDANLISNKIPITAASSSENYSEDINIQLNSNLNIEDVIGCLGKDTVCVIDNSDDLDERAFLIEENMETDGIHKDSNLVVEDASAANETLAESNKNLINSELEKCNNLVKEVHCKNIITSNTGDIICENEQKNDTDVKCKPKTGSSKSETENVTKTDKKENINHSDNEEKINCETLLKKWTVYNLKNTSKRKDNIDSGLTNDSSDAVSNESKKQLEINDNLKFDSIKEVHSNDRYSSSCETMYKDKQNNGKPEIGSKESKFKNSMNTYKKEDNNDSNRETINSEILLKNRTVRVMIKKCKKINGNFDCSLINEDHPNNNRNTCTCESTCTDEQKRDIVAKYELKLSSDETTVENMKIDPEKNNNNNSHQKMINCETMNESKSVRKQLELNDSKDVECDPIVNYDEPGIENENSNDSYQKMINSATILENRTVHKSVQKSQKNNDSFLCSLTKDISSKSSSCSSTCQTVCKDEQKNEMDVNCEPAICSNEFETNQKNVNDSYQKTINCVKMPKNRMVHKSLRKKQKINDRFDCSSMKEIHSEMDSYSSARQTVKDEQKSDTDVKCKPVINSNEFKIMKVTKIKMKKDSNEPFQEIISSGTMLKNRTVRKTVKKLKKINNDGDLIKKVPSNDGNSNTCEIMRKDEQMNHNDLKDEPKISFDETKVESTKINTKVNSNDLNNETINCKNMLKNEPTNNSKELETENVTKVDKKENNNDTFQEIIREPNLKNRTVCKSIDNLKKKRKRNINFKCDRLNEVYCKNNRNSNMSKSECKDEQKNKIDEHVPKISFKNLMKKQKQKSKLDINKNEKVLPKTMNTRSRDNTLKTKSWYKELISQNKDHVENILKNVESKSIKSKLLSDAVTQLKRIEKNVVLNNVVQTKEVGQANNVACINVDNDDRISDLSDANLDRFTVDIKTTGLSKKDLPLPESEVDTRNRKRTSSCRSVLNDNLIERNLDNATAGKKFKSMNKSLITTDQSKDTLNSGIESNMKKTAEVMTGASKNGESLRNIDDIKNSLDSVENNTVITSVSRQTVKRSEALHKRQKIEKLENSADLLTTKSSRLRKNSVLDEMSPKSKARKSYDAGDLYKPRPSFLSTTPRRRWLNERS